MEGQVLKALENLTAAKAVTTFNLIPTSYSGNKAPPVQVLCVIPSSTTDDTRTINGEATSEHKRLLGHPIYNEAK